MTVSELIEELNKFPMNAPITPYEGEIEGITIGGVDGEYVFIYTDCEKDTEIIK